MFATQDLNFLMLLVRLEKALLFLILPAAPVVDPAPPQTLIAIKTNCAEGHYTVTNHIAMTVTAW